MLRNAIIASCCGAAFSLMWLMYREKHKVRHTKVYFYNPLVPKTCGCQHKFNINCQEPGCSNTNTREIINCLRNASESIDVCVFTISNQPISRAVVEAYRRGICVRVVVSNCVLLNTKEVKLFQSIGIPVKYQKDKHTSYMHNKFAVVDSTWLIHGSMNWTRQATFDNWESVFITDKPCLVDVFSEAFEKIWTII